MKHLIVFVVSLVLTSVLGTERAVALCTPRQFFELVVTDKVSPDSDPRNLVSNQGVPLGCAISRDKSAADLCAGANGSPLPFDIVVTNRCALSVDVLLKIKKQHGSYSPIDFRPSTSCDDATGPGNAPQTLGSGASHRVTCTTNAYAMETNPTQPDFAGFFTIDIKKVNGTNTRNGMFDPRIAVERDGDVTSSKHQWLTLFAVSLLALGLGGVLGWIARSRRQGVGV